MEIQAFTFFQESLPDLRAPHALASVRPWVDVGNVGYLVLADLEATFKAEPLAHLTKPGAFIDYTRYRPTAYFKEGLREVELPNSTLSFAKGPKENDLLFLHLLEPHANGDDYVYALLEILERLGVKRYFLIGSMYDMVPHTKPLLISGSASDPETQRVFAKYGVSTSRYQGPTTILTLLSREAARKGMETMSLIVRLPQYAPLEEDHAGRLRLLELLSELYDFPLDLADAQSKADEQLRQINSAVDSNPQLKRVVAQLEERYASQLQEEETNQEPTPLPPAIERFLREMDT